MSREWSFVILIFAICMAFVSISLLQRMGKLEAETKTISERVEKNRDIIMMNGLWPAVEK